MKSATMFYNARLLDESILENGAVLVSEGKILYVFLGSFSDEEKSRSSAESVLGKGYELSLYNCEGFTLTPAFIDMHVHLRDPGQTQKEDLLSGLTACAHGGYGTVVAMPNTNPVISTSEQAQEVMARGNSLSLTHLIQSLSITNNFEGNDTSNLDGLDKNHFPLVTEDGHDVEKSSVMLQAMIKASKNGQIVSCHCEDSSLAKIALPHRKNALSIMKENSLSAWGKGDVSKVPENALKKIDFELGKANEILALAENIATERNIQIANAASCHVHICHISTKKSVEYVKKAKENGILVTAEATPHHIALTGDKEPLIRALVNPPLRCEEDRLSVIEGLKNGTIDCIATDHAPHTAEDKANGSPGFSGIETAYGVCNKVLVKDSGFSEKHLSSLMSANPARILGLEKGLLKIGYDADFAILDSEEKWIADSRKFFSKGKATPFDGAELCGKVKGLFISGRKVF